MCEVEFDWNRAASFEHATTIIVDGLPESQESILYCDSEGGSRSIVVRISCCQSDGRDTE